MIDCTINLNKALDWQRSDAEFIKQFIANKQAWYEKNHCKFWNDWAIDVFNLETANEFGLSVWSVILDESLQGESSPSAVGFPAFGFGSNNKNFGRGGFGVNTAQTISFTTEQKRLVLKLKAYILFGFNGSIAQLNERLERLFGTDQISALDGFDMTWTYVVRDREIIDLIREIKRRNLLPRPAGVDVKVIYNAAVRRWGFGKHYFNFNRGNFIKGEL